MFDSSLPARCDVLVVGAGPAGSACAQWLARHGVDVVLVDAHAFPRDKVCGDGLIPDAHHALQRLGVHSEVMAQAQAVAAVGVVAPRGGRVNVPGQLAVLPRKQLDDILKRAAERAGARFFAPLRFEACVEDSAGRVVGARLKSATGSHEIATRWVVLATGALPQALLATGMCQRQAPSGMAARGYMHAPGLVGKIDSLEVVWHKRLGRGYGWIFPCADGVFNIGVGLSIGGQPGGEPGGQPGKQAGKQTRRDQRDPHQDSNLRRLLDVFSQVHPPARDLLAQGQWLGPLKGAPLRCGLEGARLGRPGLLVTGEAAGSTYAFTGEGIGKAMETGLLAAQALLGGADTADAANAAPADAARLATYAAAVLALKPRFDLYERANGVSRHPWLIDLLVWRAQRSPAILRRMAGVLEETGNPGNLVSLRGVMRLVLPTRWA